MKFVSATIAVLPFFSSVVVNADSITTKGRNLRGRKQQVSLEKIRNLQSSNDYGGIKLYDPSQFNVAQINPINEKTEIIGSTTSTTTQINYEDYGSNGKDHDNDGHSSKGSSLSGLANIVSKSSSSSSNDEHKSSSSSSKKSCGHSHSKSQSKNYGGFSKSKDSHSKSESYKKHSSGKKKSGSSTTHEHKNRKSSSKKSSSSCDRLNLSLSPKNDVFNTNLGESISLTDAFLLTNDVNMNKDTVDSTLEIVSYSEPANGHLELTDDGFTYSPYSGFEGLDTIDYSIGDGVNPGVNTATIGIIVGNPGNLAPMLDDDSFDVIVGQPLTVTAFQLLENDFDWNGDRMSIASYSSPENGQFIKNSDGGFTYRPNEGFLGTEYIEYTVVDGTGGMSTGTITLYVKYPNKPPVAVDDTINISSGEAFEFYPMTLTENDSDPEGGDLAITYFSEPRPGEGILSRTSDGTFVYLPQGFSGQTSFLYTIADPDGGTAAATVYLNVALGNRPPQATDDSYITPVNTIIEVESPGLLANDNDPDGDEMYIETATEPQYGKLKKIKGDGRFTYEPNWDFQGVDVFTYILADGNGGETTGVVTIEVGASDNTAPVAVDDQYVVPLNSPGMILYILGNDVDADGDYLLITGTPVRPSNGDITEDQSGRYVTYKPDVNFVGTDTFTYTITDKYSSSSATVRINVAATGGNNNAISAVDDSYHATKNVMLTVRAPGVLKNDNYAGTITVSRLSPPRFGMLNLQPDGSFTYQPALNYQGSDKFEYTIVENGTNNIDTATVKIFVKDRVTPPLIDMSGGGGNTIIVGMKGTSSDCLLGFSDCSGVSTVSSSLTTQTIP